MRRLLYTGMILLLISLYPLILMAVELVVGTYASHRYQLMPIDGNRARFHGHQVEIVDTVGQHARTQPSEVFHPVDVLIDGHSYGIDAPVGIQPQYPSDDSNRYFSWLDLIVLRDQKDGTERLAIIQRTGPKEPIPWKLGQMRFRLLFLTPSGQVHEEWFDFGDRGWPVYRTLLAQFATPLPIGFYSQVLQTWPSLCYPFLFPFGTALAGLVLIIVGMRKLRQARLKQGPML